VSWFYVRRFNRARKRRVVVHTRQGHSIDGILTGIYADAIVVEAATFIRTDDTSVPLDGAQIVPWSSLEWVQEVPAGAGAENA